MSLGPLAFHWLTVVNRFVRPRMACACCEAICQAPLPSRPIERGRPGPGLLAHVLVSKYADHLPLYRQSQIFERDGIDLDRSTLSDWVGKSAALLEPLADAIGRHVQRGQAIFADDTPIKMQAKGAGKCRGVGASRANLSRQKCFARGRSNYHQRRLALREKQLAGLWTTLKAKLRGVALLLCY